MTIISEVFRNQGHPWDGRAGFDHLYVNANKQEEMDAFVAAAKKKFWAPWLIGTSDETGLPGGLMFKPSGITVPWDDSPERPHPGCTPN